MPVHAQGPRASRPRGEDSAPGLCSLDPELLLAILTRCGSRELACLECACRLFRQPNATLPGGQAASLTECAAEMLARAHKHVSHRPGDSRK